MCVECSTALLHVRQHLWMLSNFVPINTWNLQTHQASQSEKICDLLLILKLKQTISLQNYILSETLGPSSGLYPLETCRQIQLILYRFYIKAQTSILISQGHNMSRICLKFQARIHLMMGRVTRNI
jgi:hypothetical protein